MSAKEHRTRMSHTCTGKYHGTANPSEVRPHTVGTDRPVRPHDLTSRYNSPDRTQSSTAGIKQTRRPKSLVVRSSGDNTTPLQRSSREHKSSGESSSPHSSTRSHRIRNKQRTGHSSSHPQNRPATCATSQTSSLAASANGSDPHQELVSYIVRKMIRFLQKSNQLFEKFIQPWNSSQDHLLIRMRQDRSRSSADSTQDDQEQLGSYSYDIKVPLMEPKQEGTFETISGVHHGIQVGETSLKLSSAATPEERRLFRQTWAPCLTHDDYLCPQKILRWFSRGILIAVQRTLNHKVLKRRKVEVMSVSGHPQLKIILTATDNDTGDADVISLSLRPVLEVCDVSDLVSLNHPFPRFCPHIRAGQQVLGRLQQDLSAGRVRCLLEPPAPASTGTEKQLLSASFKYSSRKQTQLRPSWTLDVSQLEDSLLTHSLSSDSLSTARTAYHRQSLTNHSLPPPLRSTVWLWTIKKYFTLAQSQRDWQRAFDLMIHKAVSLNYCPSFLLKSLNKFDKIDDKIR